MPYINGCIISIKKIKIELIERYGSKCQLCESTRNIILHHKVYDKRHQYTWDDFGILCQKCNTKNTRKEKTHIRGISLYDVDRINELLSWANLKFEPAKL